MASPSLESIFGIQVAVESFGDLIISFLLRSARGFGHLGISKPPENCQQQDTKENVWPQKNHAMNQTTNHKIVAQVMATE